MSDTMKRQILLAFAAISGFKLSNSHLSEINKLLTVFLYEALALSNDIYAVGT